jgi:hypothetical protein
MIIVLVIIAAALILGPAVVGGALALSLQFMAVGVIKFWPLMLAALAVVYGWKALRWLCRMLWRVLRWSLGYRQPPSYVAAMRGRQS